MEPSTLIELVRKCLAIDNQYITIDKNGIVFASKKPPLSQTSMVWYFGDISHTNIGFYNLTCDWKDAFINVELLKGIH